MLETFFFFKYNKLADRKSACKRSFPCVLNQCKQKHGMSPVYITINLELWAMSLA